MSERRDFVVEGLAVDASPVSGASIAHDADRVSRDQV
jgi:hypothetical protein